MTTITEPTTTEYIRTYRDFSIFNDNEKDDTMIVVVTRSKWLSCDKPHKFENLFSRVSDCYRVTNERAQKIIDLLRKNEWVEEGKIAKDGEIWLQFETQNDKY